MTDTAPAADERLQAMLADYVDGTLTPAERAEVEAALAADPELRAEVEDLRGSMGLLKSLSPAAAPPELGKTVEDTIHRRSAGRFFGRRTLGDRVPFGVLLILGLIALVAIVALLWSSPSGSLKRDRPAPPPPPTERVAPPP
ncbi:MAG: zf-HC2 domain-containing protein [Myxococcales bacterium]|nr:zf-HC2 domain-containing protein [Myxococcales bacterium]